MLATMDNQRFFRDLMDEANSRQRELLSDRPARTSRLRQPDRPRAAAARSRRPGHAQAAHRGHADARREHRRHRRRQQQRSRRGMRRISDDLTSYYLLGYYSTNAKLDGRFRSLKVRVKQPGVEVRARAAIAPRPKRRSVGARAPRRAGSRNDARRHAAIDRLGRIRPEARFRINAVASAGVKRHALGRRRAAGGRRGGRTSSRRARTATSR